METPRPGDQHKMLSRFAGTWIGEERMHPSPWTPEGFMAEGRITASMKLDGFYLVSDYEQRVGDQVTFRGHGVYGYDLMRKAYTFYWFDTMGMDPGKAALGQWEGDTLAFQWDSPMGHGRGVYTLEGDGTYTFSMSGSEDGENWAPLLDGRYRRVD